MKKFLSILLVVLMMFSVLFVTISCKQEATPTPTPTPEPEPEVDPTIAEHCDPILPSGTGQVVPSSWSVDADGKTGLSAFVTDGSRTNVTEDLIKAVKETPQSFFDETPTNVIYIIGDGMGLSHLKMSEEYKGELIMTMLPYFTESMTDCYVKASQDPTDYDKKTTTDSPAGGTQLLTGYKTRYGYISLDVDGNAVKNLNELAKSKGWKTACVTNDHIADATPADDLVHNTSRYHQDVLYYQELMENMPDLLMGWDWGMGNYFVGSEGTWEARMLKAEKGGLADGIDREYDDDATLLSALNTNGPVAFLKSLTDAQKTALYPYSLYYHVWSTETDMSVEFTTWLDSGLSAYCSQLDTVYGNPEDNVNRFLKFKEVLANEDTDFDKPVLGSWTSDGNDYEAKKPNRGYLLHGSLAKAYPNFAEMVAYTLYQMDKEADAASTGFYCMIENTCTDGWGHSGNFDTKYVGVMNEVQCCDEGIAIAVKYVLEHPDTLLVISADHETGGFTFRTGWENDITKIKSTTTGHSSQNVPLIAFGAGADRFSAEAIAAAYAEIEKAHVSENGNVHEGWIAGQIIGQLMGDEDFGQPADYKGN